MQVIVLHNTETEEPIGMITPLSKIDFFDVLHIIKDSFIDFHKSSVEYNDGDYSIEDFVEWHNEHSDIKIDWVVYDYIQLSEKDVE